jgi:hypothetical protein
MENKLLLVAAGVLGLLVISIFSSSSGNPDGLVDPQKAEGNVIYIAYSDTCPHCHTLIEYMNSHKGNVTLAGTTDWQLYQGVLAEHGVDWDFGVPLMFAVSGGEFIGLQGFPSESQEWNGYFVNQEFERQLCERQGGEPHFTGVEYAFCELPGGLFLGNYHSADYIIGVCQESGCEDLYS